MCNCCGPHRKMSPLPKMAMENTCIILVEPASSTGVDRRNTGLYQRLTRGGPRIHVYLKSFANNSLAPAILSAFHWLNRDTKQMADQCPPLGGSSIRSCATSYDLLRSYKFYDHELCSPQHHIHPFPSDVWSQFGVFNYFFLSTNFLQA
jgi:hypothetical protein